jgi:hypothetical protein
VRATIILIVTSMWEMFTRTGCPDDHAATNFEAFTNMRDRDRRLCLPRSAHRSASALARGLSVALPLLLVQLEG